MTAKQTYNWVVTSCHVHSALLLSHAGEAPVDPSIGFLPPNNGTDGQGFVTFSVRAREQVSNLFRIDATASIIFDQNEPIDTPPIFNTVNEHCIGSLYFYKDSSYVVRSPSLEVMKAGVRDNN